MIIKKNIGNTVSFLIIFFITFLLTLSCISGDEKGSEIILKNMKGNENVTFEILLPEYGSVFEPVLTIKYTNKKKDSILKFRYEIKNSIGMIKSQDVCITVKKEDSYLKNILYKELSINLGRFVSPLAGLYTLEIYDINRDNSIVAIALEKNITSTHKKAFK